MPKNLILKWVILGYKKISDVFHKIRVTKGFIENIWELLLQMKNSNFFNFKTREIQNKHWGIVVKLTNEKKNPNNSCWGQFK